nr:unnamed protein product [Digitaria exilis]
MAAMASRAAATVSLDLAAAAPALSRGRRPGSARPSAPRPVAAGGLRMRSRAVVAAAAAAAAPAKAGADEVVLQPIREISGTVKLPGSKSLSNRILLLSALSEGTTVVDNLLESEDVHYMLGALKALGLSVEADKAAKRAVVVGCGGKFPVEKDAKEEVQLFLGNAGTAMRPLTAAVTAAGGNATYVLDGVPRMRERPIGDLVIGLKQLGADVDCFLGTDCPPVRIKGIGGLPGGKVKLSGSISSQYLSALLMAAPLALGDVEIEIIDKLISIPYVEMTLRLMERFGVKAEHSDSWDRFYIKGGQKYKVKETERMVAIRTELTKLGASVEEGPDYCIITPPEKLNVTAIDTYDDHRMAMAFSLAACAEVPVTIRDPGCTRKTFPNYFDVLSTFVKN